MYERKQMFEIVLLNLTLQTKQTEIHRHKEDHNLQNENIVWFLYGYET
jgi:hypothetical protein